MPTMEASSTTILAAHIQPRPVIPLVNQAEEAKSPQSVQV
jgi:hypothetical protein